MTTTAAPSAEPRSPYWGVLLGALLLLAAINSLQLGLGMLGMGVRPQWWVVLAGGAVFVLSSLVYLPVLWWLRRRWPAERVGWSAHLALVLVTLAAFATVETATALPLQRLLVGSGLVFRGSTTARVIGSFLTLASVVGIATVADLFHRLRARESHALQLEASLAEARLQALSLQLHPHFLFNTLTAISVLVHRDPAAADTMLTRLADLLRATLRQPAQHEIPLRDEMALLGRYLDIMRVRYGPRLGVQQDVAAELGDFLVPSFVLQPLVENALEHGIARRAGPGLVAIAAVVEGGRLRLTVSDDGPGLAGSVPVGDGDGNGIGISNTRRRLEQLYGRGRWLVLEDAPGGGTRAVVEMPLRRAGEFRQPLEHAWT
jgi:two-component system, LytTR family, sensor kinase